MKLEQIVELPAECQRVVILRAPVAVRVHEVAASAPARIVHVVVGNIILPAFAARELWPTLLPSMDLRVVLLGGKQDCAATVTALCEPEGP